MPRDFKFMQEGREDFNARPAQLVAPQDLTLREQDLFNALKTQYRLSYLQVMLTSGVAGRFVKPLLGSAIGVSTTFLEIYRNTASGLVAVTIAAQFGAVPGKALKLSRSASDNVAEVIDYLGNAAAPPSFGKLISYPIILKPNEALYATTANTLVALDGNDVFTVRVFNPSEYLSDDIWQSRR